MRARELARFELKNIYPFSRMDADGWQYPVLAGALLMGGIPAVIALISIPIIAMVEKIGGKEIASLIGIVLVCAAGGALAGAVYYSTREMRSRGEWREVAAYIGIIEAYVWPVCMCILLIARSGIFPMEGEQGKQLLSAKFYALVNVYGIVLAVIGVAGHKLFRRKKF